MALHQRKSFSQRSRDDGYEHRVLDIARVTRVVKGGRRFRFRALVAVGDRAGTVGVGVAKGQDVSSAIDKALRQARRSVIHISLREGTIPYEITKSYGAVKVLLRPARRGRGLIAGGAVRIVCDIAGIHNLTAKVVSRSGNKLNVARATILALQLFQTSKVGAGDDAEKQEAEEEKKGEKAPETPQRDSEKNVPVQGEVTESNK